MKQKPQKYEVLVWPNGEMQWYKKGELFREETAEEVPEESLMALEELNKKEENED